jgi:hypothetical protein
MCLRCLRCLRCLGQGALNGKVPDVPELADVSEGPAFRWPADCLEGFGGTL